MSKELLERLRYYDRYAQAEDRHILTIYGQAAQEIENLESENRKLSESLGYCRKTAIDVIAEERAEKDKLKEVLQNIAEQKTTDAVGKLEYAHDNLIYTARLALEKKRAEDAGQKAVMNYLPEESDG